MIASPRGTGGSRWALGVAAMLAVAVACSDSAITGPVVQQVRARFGLRAANVPVMQASNLPINNVRVRITLAGGGVLDTTVVYPGTDSLVLALTLQRDGESFPALIQYRSDTTTLFETQGVVRARASNSTDTTSAPSLPAPVPTGPSVAATTIALSPRDTSIALGDSMRFRSVARDAAGAVLASNRYVINWSTSDTGAAIIGDGAFRAPRRRITVRVVGTTPNGVKDSTTVTLVPVAVRALLDSGNAQSGSAGALLSRPLVVRVLAADSLGVANVPVRFRALTATALVSDSVVLTDVNGRARSGLTLATTTGAVSYDARVGSLPLLTASATAVAGAAAKLVPVAGDAQSGTVGTTLAVRPSVRVTDALGNVVSGATVNFAILAGAGTVAGPTATSDAAGLAAPTTWTLGSLVGTNRLIARLGTSDSTIFTATSTAAPARFVAKVLGDAQVALVGTVVPQVPTVRVTDQFGNQVAGASVSFAVKSGGGSLTGGTAISSAAGLAFPSTWTLGATPGSNELIARLGTLDSTVFSATAQVGASVNLLKLSGDGQSATVATAPTQPVVVRVTDALSNPIAGVAVRFKAQSAGTLVQVGFDTVTVLTDVSGQAGVFPVLRQTVGANVVEATAGALGPVTFTMQGVAGAAARLATPSGDGQSAPVGTAVTGPIAVRVVDLYGNAVAGATVQYAVKSGGGSVVGTPTTSSASGDAGLTSWTLGTVPGSNTLVARLALLDSITFTATATTGAAAKLVKVAGDAQTADVNTAVSIPPQVRVTDAFGNPVAAGAATVNFTVVLGGGTVVGGSGAVTVAGGLAAPTSWTLGAAAGENRLKVRLGTLDSAEFVATAQVVSASSLVVQGGNGQSATVGTTASNPLVVRALDAQAAPVAGIRVIFRAVTVGAQVTGGLDTITATTDASGTASTTARVSTLAGTNTYTATTPGASAVTFTVVGTVAAPATLGVISASTGTDTVYRIVAPVPQVEVRDAFGNAVPGVIVRYQTASVRSGTVSVDTATTDSLGRATMRGTWRLDSLVGVDTLRADLPAAGTVVQRTFIWTTVAAPPTRLFVDSGGSQTAIRNQILPTPIVLRVTDAYQNPVAGRTISYLAQADQEAQLVLQTGVATSGANGIVRIDSIRAGAVGGYFYVSMISDYGFGVLAYVYTASNVFSIVADSGDGLTAPAGSTPAVVPRFVVRDDNGVPMPGLRVDIAHTYPDTNGGRQTTGTRVFSAVSGDSGYVRLTGWTLGPVPGTNTVTVSSGGITGSLMANGTGIGLPSAANSILPVGSGRLIRPTSSGITGIQVRVVNAAGGSLPNQTIVFSRLDPGSGNVIPMDSAATDATGVATVPSFTLSANPGRTRVLASISSSQILFTLPIDAPGLPTYLASESPAIISHYAFNPIVPTASALLLDENGIPVSGRTVTWTITQPSAAGGTGGGTTLRTGVVTSDSEGRVNVLWQFNTARAGNYTMTMNFGTAKAMFALSLFTF